MALVPTSSSSSSKTSKARSSISSGQAYYQPQLTSVNFCLRYTREKLSFQLPPPAESLSTLYQFHSTFLKKLLQPRFRSRQAPVESNELQLNLWPLITAGHSVTVIGLKNSGKTSSYILMILNQLWLGGYLESNSVNFTQQPTNLAVAAAEGHSCVIQSKRKVFGCKFYTVIVTDSPSDVYYEFYWWLKVIFNFRHKGRGTGGYRDIANGIRILKLIESSSMDDYFDVMNGCAVLICTPEAMLKLIELDLVSINDNRIFIIDQVNSFQMDSTLLQQLIEVTTKKHWTKNRSDTDKPIKHCRGPYDFISNRQTLLFSRSWSLDISRFFHQIQLHPILVTNSLLETTLLFPQTSLNHIWLSDHSSRISSVSYSFDLVKLEKILLHEIDGFDKLSVAICSDHKQMKEVEKFVRDSQNLSSTWQVYPIRSKVSRLDMRGSIKDLMRQFGAQLNRIQGGNKSTKVHRNQRKKPKPGPRKFLVLIQNESIFNLTLYLRRFDCLIHLDIDSQCCRFNSADNFLIALNHRLMLAYDNLAGIKLYSDKDEETDTDNEDSQSNEAFPKSLESKVLIKNYFLFSYSSKSTSISPNFSFSTTTATPMQNYLDVSDDNNNSDIEDLITDESLISNLNCSSSYVIRSSIQNRSNKYFRQLIVALLEYTEHLVRSNGNFDNEQTLWEYFDTEFGSYIERSIRNGICPQFAQFGKCSKLDHRQACWNGRHSIDLNPGREISISPLSNRQPFQQDFFAAYQLRFRISHVVTANHFYIQPMAYRSRHELTGQWLPTHEAELERLIQQKLSQFCFKTYNNIQRKSANSDNNNSLSNWKLIPKLQCGSVYGLFYIDQIIRVRLISIQERLPTTPNRSKLNHTVSSLPIWIKTTELDLDEIEFFKLNVQLFAIDLGQTIQNKAYNLIELASIDPDLYRLPPLVYSCYFVDVEPSNGEYSWSNVIKRWFKNSGLSNNNGQSVEPVAATTTMENFLLQFSGGEVRNCVTGWIVGFHREVDKFSISNFDPNSNSYAVANNQTLWLTDIRLENVLDQVGIKQQISLAGELLKSGIATRNDRRRFIRPIAETATANRYRLSKLLSENFDCDDSIDTIDSVQSLWKATRQRFAIQYLQLEKPETHDFDDYNLDERNVFIERMVNLNRIWVVTVDGRQKIKRFERRWTDELNKKIRNHSSDVKRNFFHQGQLCFHLIRDSQSSSIKTVRRSQIITIDELKQCCHLVYLDHGGVTIDGVDFNSVWPIFDDLFIACPVQTVEISLADIGHRYNLSANFFQNIEKTEAKIELIWNENCVSTNPTNSLICYNYGNCIDFVSKYFVRKLLIQNGGIWVDLVDYLKQPSELIEATSPAPFNVDKTSDFNVDLDKSSSSNYFDKLFQIMNQTLLEEETNDKVEDIGVKIFADDNDEIIANRIAEQRKLRRNNSVDSFLSSDESSSTTPSTDDSFSSSSFANETLSKSSTSTLFSLLQIRNKFRKEQLMKQELNENLDQKENKIIDLKTNKVEHTEFEEIELQEVEFESKEAELALMEVELESKEVELETKEIGLGLKEIELKIKEVSEHKEFDEIGLQEVEFESKQVERELEEVELESKEVELESKEVELESKEVELESKEVELESKEVELESKEVELESKEIELKIKEVFELKEFYEIGLQEVEFESKEVERELKEVELESKEVEFKIDEVIEHTEIDKIEVGLKEVQIELNEIMLELKEVEVKSNELSRSTNEPTMALITKEMSNSFRSILIPESDFFDKLIAIVKPISAAIPDNTDFEQLFSVKNITYEEGLLSKQRQDRPMFIDSDVNGDDSEDDDGSDSIRPYDSDLSISTSSDSSSNAGDDFDGVDEFKFQRAMLLGNRNNGFVDFDRFIPDIFGEN